jgi:hypothetical protein
VTKQVETDDAVPLGDAQIAEVLTRWWGFDRLRPLQAEAIAGEIAEARNIHGPNVNGWRAINHPFREAKPHTARLAEASHGCAQKSTSR